MLLLCICLWVCGVVAVGGGGGGGGGGGVSHCVFHLRSQLISFH